MKRDQIITSVPMLIEGTYYNVVRSANHSTCAKCAFGGIGTPCPVLYMQVGTSPEREIEEGKIEGEPKFKSKEGFFLCSYFGDTIPVYFDEVEER